MNPVKSVAEFLQYWLPTSDGWYAAAVPMAGMIVAGACIAFAALLVWILDKTNMVKL